MLGCVHKATKAWEVQLEEKYEELLAYVSEEQKVKLEQAQEEWLVYCQKEEAFSNKLYNDQEGSMWQIAAAQTKLSLTRQRVLDLDGYLALFLMER